MKTVDECLETSDLNPFIISIKGGNGGLVNAQSGCAPISSQRSFVSSIGSKNATGSAAWINTGRPNSPAVSQMGLKRSSSTLTNCPLSSLTCNPNGFQIFNPCAPTSFWIFSRPAAHSPNPSPILPHLNQSTPPKI